MEHINYRIGVLYQDEDSRAEEVARLLEEQDNVKTTLVKRQGNRVDRIERDTYYDNTFIGSEHETIMIHEVFTFHRMITQRDAHNLAGMQFTGYNYLKGDYSYEVLMYLSSRLQRRH